MTQKEQLEILLNQKNSLHVILNRRAIYVYNSDAKTFNPLAIRGLDLKREKKGAC